MSTELHTPTPHQVRWARSMIARPRPGINWRIYLACWNVLRLARAGQTQRADAPDGAA